MDNKRLEVVLIVDNGRMWIKSSATIGQLNVLHAYRVLHKVEVT